MMVRGGNCSGSGSDFMQIRYWGASRMFKRETIENGFSPHFFDNIARYMKNHIGGLPLSLS